jgi:hypothetical protein
MRQLRRQKHTVMMRGERQLEHSRAWRYALEPLEGREDVSVLPTFSLNPTQHYQHTLHQYLKPAK